MCCCLKEQEVDDNAERRVENSSKTEMKGETLERPVTWGEGTEDKREEMPIEESQPDSLVDFDFYLDREEEFEGNGIGVGTAFPG